MHNKVFNFDSWAFASTLLFEQFGFQEYICGLQTLNGGLITRKLTPTLVGK
jgi:hypothetical protein